MLKYILKRLLQMVPTVFGVVLLTFILFNVAGGDLAFSVDELKQIAGIFGGDYVEP